MVRLCPAGHKRTTCSIAMRCATISVKMVRPDTFDDNKKMSINQHMTNVELYQLSAGLSLVPQGLTKSPKCAMFICYLSSLKMAVSSAIRHGG